VDIAVRVEALRVDYGDVRAVDGLSLSVHVGEIFALLGPNGAGKTTTLEVLEGYRRPTSGRVEVLGLDPATGGRALRERVGIVLQEAGFDDEFSVRELLDLYAGFYPRRRDVAELLDLVGLAEKRDARVATLSGGQRRRLDLALGLVGDPELLFLDEPTTGFDPSARRQAWELVEALRSLGKTVLLTTHYLDEADHLADRVAVISRGRLVALDRPAHLAPDTASATVVTFHRPAEVPTRPEELPPLAGRLRIDGQVVSLTTTEPTSDLRALTCWAVDRGVELEGLTLSRPSLEDVYLQLVDGGSDAAPAR
jgi:ABC-2 type transport system ATP-binding protein